MTDNEKWQGNPKRTGAGAGRDGKMFEKRDMKVVLKGSQEPSNYSSERPRRNDEKFSRPNYEKRYSDKPSFHTERRSDSKPSSGRTRFSVKKQTNPNSTEYVETRFNSSGGEKRRPRIKTADYNPNAKYSKKKQVEYRRNDIDPTKPIRLNKFLANAGICSRREADEFIAAGVITVNGEVVKEMGVKVLPTDKVMFHNQQVRIEKKVYILLNKPKDTVTTAEDNLERRTVLDIVKNACSERIYPVGRLDRNTTGVLLLTNDGDLASRLTHPKYEKKKIYHAVLDKPLEIPDFESVLAGVMLDDEKVSADALNFIKDDDFRHLGIEIHSGQNRVIRRIFEKLGYKVVRLDRVFFAGLTKKNLPRGKYRFLTEREVNMLKMGAYE
jgi:23S rRNA pseudouridine2605 synthase